MKKSKRVTTTVGRTTKTGGRYVHIRDADGKIISKELFALRAGRIRSTVDAPQYSEAEQRRTHLGDKFFERVASLPAGMPKWGDGKRPKQANRRRPS